MFVANLGSQVRCNSLVPHLRTAVLTSVLWTSHMTLTEGSTRASSSMPTMAEVKFMPEPPNSSGISTPMRPCSNRRSTTSGSMASFSSISRTFGAMTSAANLATESFIRDSTSVRWLMGVGGISDRSTSSTGAACQRRGALLNARGLADGQS